MLPDLSSRQISTRTCLHFSALSFRRGGRAGPHSRLPGPLASTPQGDAALGDPASLRAPHGTASDFRGPRRSRAGAARGDLQGGGGWCLNNESRAPLPKVGRGWIAENLLPECWSPSHDSEGTEALEGHEGIPLGLQTPRNPSKGCSPPCWGPTGDVQLAGLHGSANNRQPPWPRPAVWFTLSLPGLPGAPSPLRTEAVFRARGARLGGAHVPRPVNERGSCSRRWRKEGLGAERDLGAGVDAGGVPGPRPVSRSSSLVPGPSPPRSPGGRAP